MAAVLFMNSIVDVNTTPAPDNVTAYIMATDQDPREMPQEMNYNGDYIVLGGGNKMNRLKAPPQASAQFVNDIVGQTAAGEVTAYMMATVADPRSSAGWALKGNRRGNRKCNYPPQIGA